MASEELEEKTEGGSLKKKLEATGWGLFFIWIGIILWADIPSSAALLGIGIITLVMQIVRKALGLDFEGFWCLVGAAFLLAGIWQHFKVDLPLLAILLIVAGLAVLWKGFQSKE
jgi:hypothetical protein